MRHGINSARSICNAFPFGVAALLSLLPAAGVCADQGERLVPYLRQYSAQQERQIRQLPVLAVEPGHRSDADERNGRRWSPEERRQLRRDVHEAGRDVYGYPPRRAE